jgi:hypothetical protein
MTAMNQSFSRHFSRGRVVAAAAFALFATSALAQTPAPTPTPAPVPAPQSGGAMGHGGMGGGMPMMGAGHGEGMPMMDHAPGGGMMHPMFCGASEHIDGRLAYLKAELKLTDQQQGVWNTFADTYRAAAQKIGKTCAANEAAGADHTAHQGVVGHLSMMERHMTDHLEAIRALKGAIEPLYAALNDDQKKTADHIFGHIMGVGMGKMMGGMEQHGGSMGGMGGMGGMGQGGGMGGMDHGGMGHGGMDHGGMDHGAGH